MWTLSFLSKLSIPNSLLTTKQIREREKGEEGKGGEGKRREKRKER